MTIYSVDPYDILGELWPSHPEISDILNFEGWAITVSGSNEILAKGFFHDLSQWIRARGDPNFWLVDLDGETRRFVRFDQSDDESIYFDKISEAPMWNNHTPFPYAVRFQAFVGVTGWILISDRNAERMHLRVSGRFNFCEFEYVAKLFGITDDEKPLAP